jgi:hypothetical protein
MVGDGYGRQLAGADGRYQLDQRELMNLGHAGDRRPSAPDTAKASTSGALFRMNVLL